MRRLSGFSLMEMMTVLLIVSIVAAAAAPMINKKMTVSNTTGCPWARLANGSIVYNINSANVSTIIGDDETGNDLSPKLHLFTNNDNPFITFRRDGVEEQLALRYRANTLGLSSANPGDGGTAIGANAQAAATSVSIGAKASADKDATAVGTTATATGESATAVGAEAEATGEAATAVGTTAKATGKNTIAIGLNSNAKAEDSIAIGNNITLPENKGQGAIAIGRRIDISNIEQPQKSILISTTDDSHTIGSWSHSVILSTGISSSRKLDTKVTTGGYSVSIGYDAYGKGTSATAVGPHTTATGERSLALGRAAEATGNNSVAIGNGALASGGCSVAIGSGYTGENNSGQSIFIHRPQALHTNSVAIGRGAKTTTDNQIVLGSPGDNKDSLKKTTVYIPGDLVVGGDTYLAINNDSRIYARLNEHRDGQLHHSEFAELMLEAGDGTYVRHYTDSKFLDNLKTEGYNTNSDRRLKNVGKEFKAGLAELKKLDLFHFTYKKDKSKTPHVGVIAQDLEKVFPDAVTKGDDGFLRIRMEDMFYSLINAVKELASMFDKHDERIVQLEKENKQLTKTIEDLEKRLAKLEKQK